MGLAVAWASARRGLRTTVVDPQPGRGASWAAAGMLAPVTEVHYGEERLLRLNLASHAAYPDFIEQLERDAGLSAGYRRCGTLLVARDNDDNAALAEIFRFQQSLGLEVRRLRSGEVRDLEPGLAPSVRGGILVEGDHQVDNRALLDALIAACRALGVSFVRAEAEAISVSAGKVEGLSIAGGDAFAADRVVICAGARSGDLAGIQLPVRPVKGQLLHLRSRDGMPLLTRNIRGLDVYLVPRSDGRVVVGATVEEQGFDAAVTAGAVHDLLRYAYELAPGITEHELVEIAVGHRPGTPDNAPLIGRTSVEGLYAATGHHRNGILLLAVTSRAMGEILETGEVPEVIAGFEPTRFEREPQSL